MTESQQRTPRKPRVVPPTYHRWTAADEQLIRDHYGPLSPEPWPASQLAEVIGCPLRSLLVMVSLRGLSRQGRGRPPAPGMRTWWEFGNTDREISELLGCRVDLVTSWRFRHGLPPNPGTMGRPRRRPVAVDQVDDRQPTISLSGCGCGAE